jgi:hypothetical protein
MVSKEAGTGAVSDHRHQAASFDIELLPQSIVNYSLSSLH